MGGRKGEMGKGKKRGWGEAGRGSEREEGYMHVEKILYIFNKNKRF